jgi:hypothetical protein
MPINLTGPVIQGTRRNLVQGLRARPMPETAVNAALEQAGRFAEQLIETYSADVAAGEVGPGGTARASEEAILGARAPTALMYGRVQSGKTAAMILTSALCLDNGFRVIVVLTADNVALVEQTTNRFKALDGPRIFSSVKLDGYEWEGQEDELRQDIATDGLVLVCAKDAFHLPRVIQFLQQIEAPGYPALVFDDEADAATPDTTLAARSSGRSNAPQFPSTINRRVLENQRPGEEGESIGELFPHSLYVQVTATPYLLFLQRSDSRIRPNVTFLLEPGEGYCGGEVFFSAFYPRSNDPPVPPIVLVPDGDGRALNLRRVPQGLAASIEFFLIAAAAKAAADGGMWRSEGVKHLSHPSHRIAQHAVVASHIERHLTEIRRQIRGDLDGALERFNRAYRELRRTVPDARPLDELVQSLPEAIRQAEIIRVNSDTDVPQYGPRLNFLIGGNILGRGLTIDDLLVTYYVREAQVSQMDTIWQHARMYGYRRPLLPFTRVYLPLRVAARFKEIHEAEEELRALIRRQAAGEEVLVRVATGTRATRPNATEPSVLRVVGAGLDQLFPLFVEEDQAAAMRLRGMLIAAGVPIALGERAGRATAISLEMMFELIEAVPIVDGDPGRWSAGSISALVESFREQYQGNATVYVRGLTERPPPGGWIRGRLSGPEIGLIRGAAPGVPVLALMYLDEPDRPSGWYPTLVLPPNTPAYILNPL